MLGAGKSVVREGKIRTQDFQWAGRAKGVNRPITNVAMKEKTEENRYRGLEDHTFP